MEMREISGEHIIVGKAGMCYRAVSSKKKNPGRLQCRGVTGMYENILSEKFHPIQHILALCLSPAPVG
jgi:hypothetical protein